jgi:hypothetical protein
MMLLHLVLLVMFVAKNVYLIFHPSYTLVRASSQFLLCIFLLSPVELASSQLCKSDRSCPVIEISSF